MVTKNWKKLVALFLAAVMILAYGPATPKYALADTEDGAAAEAGEGDENAKEEEGKEVNEDGEVVQSGSTGKVDKKDWITKKDYEKITESDSYIMYLYEPRLSVLLENKKTGKIIETTLSDEKDDGNSNPSWNAYMKSGVVVNAMVGVKNAFQADLVMTKHTLEVTKNENGFSAKIFWDDPRYQFGFTVDVALEDDEFVVGVPEDSIVEKKEGSYINSISLFPMMGYTFLDEKEGYMLIPDGNGALIKLNNKEGRYSTGFSQMIYGSDIGFMESKTKKYLWDKIDMIEQAGEVLAPIFGMAHTKEGVGYIAVVEKGEKRANIEAQPNGVMVNYNRCFAKFILRDLYVQPLNNSNSGTVTQAEKDRTHTDMQVRYMLLSGNNANYSAMAVKYRDYLLKNKLLTKKDTSYNTRVDFLGTDREEFLLSTTPVTMTTASDISEIYSELRGQGVSSLLSLYKGWQDGGIYNVPIKEYDADSKIGGNDEVTKLIKDSEQNNYKVYLYSDALRLNPATNTFNFSTIKKVNKRTYEEEIFAEVYEKFNFITPNNSVKYFENYVDDATKKGIANFAVSGISNTMFSYSYRSEYFQRQDAAQAYEESLKKVDATANLALEKPCAYLWDNTEAFLDMPLGSSDYMYVDEEVPFLSMVLKGIVPMYSDYVNFEANKQKFFLQMVEAGVYPSFYLTKENSSKLIYTNSADLYSTEYKTYKDSVVEYDKKLRELNEATGNANIVKHEELAEGVVAVTYSNGVKVYVNYNNSPVSAEGNSVEALSYTYKVGEAE